MSRFTGRALFAAAISVCALPALASQPLAQMLAQAAPKADPTVINLALQATACAMQTGEPVAQRVAVIDYSRPSSEPRLWVFDLRTGELVNEELVAHGRNSGDNYARTFSNQPNSRASSIGLYRTAGTYDGDNGYSLRLQGLEPGFNDHAMDRAVVMHGAPYVDPKLIKANGRIGRSWGCPAVRPEIAHTLIDELKGGQYLFAYYPDPKWLASSPYLNCGAGTTAHATPVAQSTPTAHSTMGTD